MTENCALFFFSGLEVEGTGTEGTATCYTTKHVRGTLFSLKLCPREVMTRSLCGLPVNLFLVSPFKVQRA
jgi:hypothetical protein